MITLEEVQKDLAQAKRHVDDLTARLNGAIGIVSYLEAKEAELLKRAAEQNDQQVTAGNTADLNALDHEIADVEQG